MALLFQGWNTLMLPPLTVSLLSKQNCPKKIYTMTHTAIYHDNKWQLTEAVSYSIGYKIQDPWHADLQYLWEIFGFHKSVLQVITFWPSVNQWHNVFIYSLQSWIYFILRYRIKLIWYIVCRAKFLNIKVVLNIWGACIYHGIVNYIHKIYD